ncbi:ABC transporter substrate-binding protein [Cohnella faecalis]|uniref:Sugar ABC transporter substrate-binding protein n=1 Tax=Cohnella faecalis TaxID=2315694 RepID=A0A398CHT5_9BACL|nr:sugar ABC transporter substrate-binding protein [Cohnella faecalis]RIE01572.1 sugar ABC transporter substrate-binding protein [Cohnella faecalis]
MVGKKWAFLTLASITILSACSSGNTTNEASQSSEKGTEKTGAKKLTVWVKQTFSAEADELLKKRMEQFGKEKNVTVNVELISSSSMTEKYSAAIESKQTPDVAFLIPEVIKQFQEKDLLLDLSDLSNNINKVNGELFKKGLDYASVDGKIYGIPLYNSATVLFYRKDMLAKAGYDAPPKTWDEFREVAKKVTETNKGVYGAGLVFGSANDSENEKRSITWSLGASLNSADGKTPTMDTPEMSSVVKMLTDMVVVDKSVPPTSVSWDDSGNNKAYLSGQTAMIINAASVVGALKDAPDDVKNNTGVAVLPAGPKGTTVIGSTNYNGVFKNTKEPELSQELIQYVMDKSWYKTWIETVAPTFAPVYIDLANEPFWQSEYNKPIIASLEYFTYTGYPGPNMSQATEVHNQKILTQMYQRILVDKISIDKALKEAQDKMLKIYTP